MSSFTQDILPSSKTYPARIPYKTFQWPANLDYHIAELLTTESVAIGVSAQLNKDGVPERFAFSSRTKAIIIQFPGSSPRQTKNTPQPSTILQDFLASGNKPLTAFKTERVLVYIKQAFKIDASGFDLSTTFTNSFPSQPGAFLRKIVADKDASHVDTFAVNALWDCCVGANERTLLLRAWVSCCAAERCIASLRTESRLSTNHLSSVEYQSIYPMIVEIDLMESESPTEAANDFSEVQPKKGEPGQMIIHNSRFKTRVRRDEKTKVVLTDAQGRHHYATAKGTEGKRTTVKLTHKGKVNNVRSIRVLGREAQTHSEIARDQFFVSVLQRKHVLRNYAYINHLWFPVQQTTDAKKIKNTPIVGTLNPSQSRVVKAMTSHAADPLTIVHGPPGTGKTSTIAAAVKIWEAQRQPVWLVAQSNVGVLNIAKKLQKESINFRLIVSQDFYVEWHEEIYQEIVAARRVIRSDDLPKNSRKMDLEFKDVYVVLCTLSMLSNPLLVSAGVFKLVELRRLVIDEASQIGVSEYMHIFARVRTLQKVCFFGDPKQLPPYGKDAAPTLQSIFEIKHLKQRAYLLDTQYRMPIKLGEFISTAVYGTNLNSVHAITGADCVVFVDVSGGCEERHGKSLRNMDEVKTIVHLVRHYYKNKHFCVITPYDAQRNAIQEALRRESLPCDHVYNVDSFQGNEADYILVSVVRTEAPGFLKSLNRTNVMLTRCTKGMVIVSQKAFVTRQKMQKTLIGKIHTYWKRLKPAGGPSVWIGWKAIMNQHANLPGAAGVHASAPKLVNKIDSDESDEEADDAATDAQSADRATPASTALPSSSAAQIQVAAVQQQLVQCQLQLSAAMAQAALVSSLQNLSVKELGTSTSAVPTVKSQTRLPRKKNKGKGKA